MAERTTLSRSRSSCTPAHDSTHVRRFSKAGLTEPSRLLEQQPLGEKWKCCLRLISCPNCEQPRQSEGFAGVFTGCSRPSWPSSHSATSRPRAKTSAFDDQQRPGQSGAARNCVGEHTPACRGWGAGQASRRRGVVPFIEEGGGMSGRVLRKSQQHGHGARGSKPRQATRRGASAQRYWSSCLALVRAAARVDDAPRQC